MKTYVFSFVNGVFITFTKQYVRRFPMLTIGFPDIFPHALVNQGLFSNNRKIMSQQPVSNIHTMIFLTVFLRCLRMFCAFSVTKQHARQVYLLQFAPCSLSTTQMSVPCFLWCVWMGPCPCLYYSPLSEVITCSCKQDKSYLMYTVQFHCDYVQYTHSVLKSNSATITRKNIQ